MPNSIVTYTGQGFSSVNQLVHSIIRDLTGLGTPVTGSPAHHMQLVHPTSVLASVSATGTEVIEFTSTTTALKPGTKVSIRRSVNSTVIAGDLSIDGTGIDQINENELREYYIGEASPTQATLHASYDDAISFTSPVTIGGTTTTGATFNIDPTIYFSNDYNPTSDDATDKVFILESTTNVDPFARADVNVNDVTKDPWRICFQTYNWRQYPSYIPGASQPSAGSWSAADSSIIRSLGVYVGTPSTLSDNSGTPIIAYQQAWPNTVPAWLSTAIASLPTWNYNPLTNGAPTFSDSYLASKKYDYIEPVGNTGSEWTNRFEPTTAFSVKIPKAENDSIGGISGLAGANNPNTTPVIMNGDGPDVLDPSQLFVNRYSLNAFQTTLFGSSTASADAANPLSYHVTVSDHGVFIAVWGKNPEQSASGFSWVLVQRSVDKLSGITRGVLPGFPNGDPNNPGNRPLFCINSTNNQVYKFVVREHDLPAPSDRSDASANTLDNGAVINPFQQQSLTENGEYVITFLNNLNTSRFKYADELDMVGTVSADVVGGGADIEVAVYGEVDGSGASSKRTYHALWPSGQNGTKMRVMVVKDVPDPN